MDRNLIVFVVASALVLLVWSRFSTPPPRQAPPGTPAAAPSAATQAHGTSKTGAMAKLQTEDSGPAAEGDRGVQPRWRRPLAAATEVALENDVLTLTLTSEGARVRSIRLKQYKDGKRPVEVLRFWEGAGGLELAADDADLEAELNGAVYTVRSEEGGAALVFSHRTSQGAGVTKRFRLPEHGYLWSAEVAVTAPKDGFYERNLRFRIGSEATQASLKDRGEVLEVVTFSGKKIVNSAPGGGFLSCMSETVPADTKGTARGETGPIEWSGLKTKYFAAVVLPAFECPQVSFEQKAVTEEFGRKLRHVATRALVELETKGQTRLAAGATATYAAEVYTGPVDLDILQVHGRNLDKVIDLGFFTAIGRGMLWVLKLFYRFSTNWGVAILLLTLLVRSVLWFPTHKSMVSMRGMQKIQPQLQAMQQKYRGDPKRLQQEMAKVYREHGISPLLPVLGCLPLLMQMPIFIALYATLSSAIELRGTQFLWLPDLAQKDPYFAMPLLLGVTMWVQQKLGISPTMDPAQAKLMLWMMPILMTVMFISLPSGVGLYFITSNLISIAQQFFVNRAAPIPVPTAPQKA